MCIGGGQGCLGPGQWGTPMGLFKGARTHPTLHIGTRKPGTPRQFRSWALGNSLETGKMQVQTRLKVHSQAGSGCGDLKTGAGVAPLGQGMTVLRAEVGSWAMSRWGVGEREVGLWMPLVPWRPNHAVPSDQPLSHWLSLFLLFSTCYSSSELELLWGVFAVSPMDSEKPSMSCHCHQHHTPTKGRKVSGCTGLSQCCLNYE